MKALITGASSGMGRDMARYLSKKNIDLILVARRKERLEELKKELKVNVKIISLDLSDEKNVYKLYEECKNDNIDILINNAGFGLFGEFNSTDLSREINMVDVNIRAVHIITKLFLKDMVKRDSGRILNVASSAAFEPGPLMAAYYASKSYVYNLTMAIYEELRRKKSHVKISVLCPGPVDTGFNERANVKFNIKSVTPDYVVNYTIEEMMKNKLIIIPTKMVKVGVFLNRIFSRKFMLKRIYEIQKKKR